MEKLYDVTWKREGIEAEHWSNLDCEQLKMVLEHISTFATWNDTVFLNVELVTEKRPGWNCDLEELK